MITNAVNELECSLPCFHAKGIMCTIQKQYSIHVYNVGNDFLVFPFLQTIKTNTIGTLNMLGEIFIFQSCLCHMQLLVFHLQLTHISIEQAVIEVFMLVSLLSAGSALLIGKYLIIVFSFEGLAKRVHARLLLASTSEVYGGQFMLTVNIKNIVIRF